MRTRHAIPARQRLLEAAERVFSREGLVGSTTRQISHEAEVSEVTLFRLFGSKDQLIEEVVGRVFPRSKETSIVIACTSDLRADLTGYAKLYTQRLQDNLSLLRTLIGEIHHKHHVQECEVFRGIFQPLRTALTERLSVAVHKSRRVHPISAEQLGDKLNGMLFSDILRRAAPQGLPSYSLEQSIDLAVDLVVCAIDPRKAIR